MKPTNIGYKSLQTTEYRSVRLFQKVLERNIRQFKFMMEITKNQKHENQRRKDKTYSYREQSWNINLTLNDIAAEEVDVLQYWEVLIDNTRNYEAEVENRIGTTIKLFYELNNSFLQQEEVSRYTKMIVYKMIFGSWIFN